MVAEEVRNLAMRSTEAARSTNDLIEQSQANSKTGVEKVEEVEKVLERIIQSVNIAGDLTQSVSQASSEQAVGIQQVANAIVQLEDITRNNAVNSQQTASAGQVLTHQIDILHGINQQLTKLVGTDAENESGNGSNARTSLGLSNDVQNSGSKAVAITGAD